MTKLLSTPVLSFVAGACAMACLVLCCMQIQYSRKVREIRDVQRQLLEIQQNRANLNRLAADLYVYSRTNTAIRPLLQSVGINANQQ